MQRISEIRKREIIAFGVDRRFIELTAEEMLNTDIIVNKFITTLLYESKRYHWDAEHCDKSGK